MGTGVTVGGRGLGAILVVCLASLAVAAEPAVLQRSEATGLATFVQVPPGPELAGGGEGGGGTPVDPADDFVARYGALFGVSKPAAQLTREAVTTDALKHTHTRYAQLHNGVPVFGGVLKVHQNAVGQAFVGNGNIFPIPDKLSTVPDITAENAQVLALAAVTTGAPTVARCELTIVDPGWYGDPPQGARLAWYIELLDESYPLRKGVFIEAHSGELVDIWDMIQTARDRRVYDAAGGVTIPALPTRGEGQGVTNVYDVDAAYDYAGDVYDFYKRAFGRDSIDDAGMPLIVAVRVDDPSQAYDCPNAYWTGTRMVFCPGAVTDDIMAHEMTHGITQYTANLIYQNQPGQLNESFSDVFGELVDLWNGNAAFVGPPGGTPSWPQHPTGPGVDTLNNLRARCSGPHGESDGVRWLMGEGADLFGGAIRDMWDPTCYGDPDRGNSPLQTCDPGDGGGVHSGSGIPNHAFAIAVDGKTFNGQTVTGIGPIKAGAAWYRALSVYLVTYSNFKDAYWSINQAANDLVGTKPKDPRTVLLRTAPSPPMTRPRSRRPCGPSR